MTNREFILHITKQHPGMFQEDVGKMIQVVFHGLRTAIANGESLLIPGLGTLYPEFVEPRMKTLPSGERRLLDEKVRVRFKASRKFERKLTEELLGVLSNESE